MATFAPRFARIQPVLLKNLQPAEVHLPPFRASSPLLASEPSTSQRIIDRLVSTGQDMPQNLRIMSAPDRKQLSGLKAEQRDLVRHLFFCLFRACLEKRSCGEEKLICLIVSVAQLKKLQSE